MKLWTLLSFLALNLNFHLLAADFSISETPGKHVEVSYKGKSLMRLMTERDSSTEASDHETYKVYSHVMDPSDGKLPITKGSGGKYTHHRGIFIGFKVKAGKATFDFWHMKNEARNRYVKILKQDVGNNEAELSVEVDWVNGETVIIKEERTFRFGKPEANGAFMIDVGSKLTAIDSDLTVGGDREHGGCHFRADNEAAKNHRFTKYLHPDGHDVQTATDMPWSGMTFKIREQHYYVQHMTDPSAGKWQYSAYRNYGRMGSYPVSREVKKGESLDYRFGFYVSPGTFPEDAATAFAKRYKTFRDMYAADSMGHPVNEDWLNLFDGKTLTGWRNADDTVAKIKIVDGTLVIETKKNFWLKSELELADFVFEAEVKIPPGPRVNSGLCFRGSGTGKPKAYQCEVDGSDRMWSGGLVAMGGGWIQPKKGDEASTNAFLAQSKGSFKRNDWNHFRVRAVGEHIQIWTNGVLTTDARNKRRKRGYFGLQHHGIGAAYQFRNVRVKNLADKRQKPNIVFMLADDMGYGDIPAYGATDLRTPHLDRLAKEGVRFTQFYANGAECSPTRTSIFTGRYPQRVGGMECAIGTGNVGRYDDAIRLAKQNDLGVPADKAVLAKPLKAHGYATGIFGKWHLGYEEKFLPSRFGFDESFYFLGGNVDYFTHKELSPLPVLYRGDKPVERDGYMTHLLADDAVSFIERHKAQPFFLYLPFSAPHFPFQAPGDRDKVFTAENWLQGSRETYAEMLVDMDKAIGRVLAALDKAGVADNTLVVFASDHGAMGPGINAPFRGQKGGLFEGGIRTACIARWPGKLPADSVSSQVMLSMDLTASFLNAAGADPGLPLDGVDVFKHVQLGKPNFDRSIGWRARRGDRTWWAYRDGDLKYVRKLEGGVDEQWAFDLASDPGEQTSIINTKPALVPELKKKLAAWEKEVAPVR